MNKSTLHELLQQWAVVSTGVANQLVVSVEPEHYKHVARQLLTNSKLCCEQLMDLCVVDMLTYGQGEWETQQATCEGYGRAIVDQSFENQQKLDRFVVVTHLLSLKYNYRVRLKVTVPQDLVIDSLCSIWPSANWFEREAFDLFGVLFKGHPDMRRLLTDYGFIGHPFRKDFPLVGTHEMRFDAQENRCLYEKVSIDNRVLVPKVIRHAQVDQQEEHDG